MSSARSTRPHAANHHAPCTNNEGHPSGSIGRVNQAPIMSEKTHCDVPIELSTYTLKGGEANLACILSNVKQPLFWTPPTCRSRSRAVVLHVQRTKLMEGKARADLVDSNSLHNNPSDSFTHTNNLCIGTAAASHHAFPCPIDLISRLLRAISTWEPCGRESGSSPLRSARVAAMRVPWFEGRQVRACSFLVQYLSYWLSAPTYPGPPYALTLSEVLFGCLHAEHAACLSGCNNIAF
jgi:hypothetical protein